jgi:hypothetical protein
MALAPCDSTMSAARRELFAGSYEAIRRDVRERARRMAKKLEAHPDKQDKRNLRKLELETY